MEKTYARPIAAAMLLSMLLSTPALAGHDEEEHESRAGNTPVNATWQAECSACHIAYPARMLPAESWRALMSGLNRHFGADATLDAKAAKEIGAYLETNAGRPYAKAPAQPILRVSETPWFKREHRKLADKVWRSDWVKSPSNCAACHTQAAYNDYEERNIRIPK